MPYTAATAPDAIKALPKGARDIWIAAYNAAYETYKDRTNREALAHQTAWAAVKAKYRQNADGDWVAKESDSMTVEETRQILNAALAEKFGADANRMGPWIRDFDTRHVFYEHDGQTWKAAFTLNEEETEAQIGEPEKVAIKTTYTPIESLRRLIAEIAQESGQRETGDDGRAGEYVEATTTYLASGGGGGDVWRGEEGKTAGMIIEGESVLAWLREQAMTKLEDDARYPLAAYAYAPNAHRPSSWKMRMWDNPDGKMTKGRLRRLANSLGPGGDRGVPAGVPKSALSAVKRKLRAALRKVGVEAKDMPRWVKESATERVPLLTFTPLTEAEVSSKGIATVVVIEPGFNSSKTFYYPREMLAEDFEIFNGVKMYADHPTKEEERARPERSIKDWVGTITSVSLDEHGRVIAEVQIVEPWMQAKLAQLRDSDLLGEMGVSINAAGLGETREIEGIKVPVIEKLTAVKSVDFVTEPGAGGEVQMYESRSAEWDVDLVSLETLKERRPELVEAIEDEVKQVALKEARAMADIEEKVKELEGQVESLTSERDTAVSALEEAKVEQAKAEAKSIIDKAIAESELPDISKEKLAERFADAVDAEGIEEAITAEKDYVAKVTESGKVTGLGAKKADDPKDSMEALKESYKRFNPSASDEEIETFVTGR